MVALIIIINTVFVGNNSYDRDDDDVKTAVIRWAYSSRPPSVK